MSKVFEAKKKPDKTSEQRKELGTGSRAEVEELREKISELITKSPDKAALILSHWINQHQAKIDKKKSA